MSSDQRLIESLKAAAQKDDGDECARETVKLAYEAHEIFNVDKSLFFAGKQLSLFSWGQVHNLTRLSRERGAEAAVELYKNVYNLREAPVRFVAQVYGLQAVKPAQLSNGIKIIDPNLLPDSPNSSLFKNRRRDFHFNASCAVIYEAGTIKGSESSEDGNDLVKKIDLMFVRSIDAFVLSGKSSPTIGARWNEFSDPDLNEFDVGRMWMGENVDGRRDMNFQNIDDDVLGWIEKYLALPNEVADYCHGPIGRLNLARRRINAGDKAVDGSVCLESLLSGRAAGDLTHKLALRTAILLGKTLDERRRIASDIRKFYKLRSTMVHGRTRENDPADAAVAEAGLDIALACLRVIINEIVVPTPEDWELAGGPPFNRI